MSTPLLLDTFYGRIRLEGLLSTRTALHIGAGGSGDPLATDLPVVRNGAGQPFIPGSSLKGVLRSAAEALYRGAPAGSGSEGRRACDVVAGYPCVPHDRLKVLREEARKRVVADDDRRQLSGAELEAISRQVAETVWHQSCPVCRLFGSPALAGRVRFPDLPLAGELAPLELRNGVGIQRERELAGDAVLYDFEAVPPDTRFQLLVVVDNPSDAEVGLLLYLFELLDSGDLALGGKTTRGLGWVRIAWESIHETRLEARNPFRDLLVRRNLLAPEPAAPARPQVPLLAEPQPSRFPATGDPQAWGTLLEILGAMTTFNRDRLTQEAAKQGLSRASINDKLGLGLPPGDKPRGVWDLALAQLARHGALVQEGDRWLLPAEVEAKQAPEVPAEGPTPTSPELAGIYQRFIGAMATAWQEASACSTAN